MGPKVEAAAAFARSRPGKVAAVGALARHHGDPRRHQGHESHDRRPGRHLPLAPDLRSRFTPRTALLGALNRSVPGVTRGTGGRLGAVARNSVVGGGSARVRIAPRGSRRGRQGHAHAAGRPRAARRGLASGSPTGRRSRWSAPTARARRRCCDSSPATSTRRRARSSRSGGLGVMRQFIGQVRDESTVRDLLVSVAPPRVRAAAAALDAAELAMMDSEDERDADGIRARARRLVGRRRLRRRGALGRAARWRPSASRSTGRSTARPGRCRAASRSGSCSRRCCAGPTRCCCSTSRTTTSTCRARSGSSSGSRSRPRPCSTCRTTGSCWRVRRPRS